MMPDGTRAVISILALKVVIVLILFSVAQATVAPQAHGQTDTCTDSDGGLNYEVAGFVVGVGATGLPQTRYDVCETGDQEGWV
ncbi:MAG: hypothetical protein GX597_20000, partial [Anaerolineaceae bacterium]|nr:hypothetical protein [Anaerolineaceae bacterium]